MASPVSPLAPSGSASSPLLHHHSTSPTSPRTTKGTNPAEPDLRPPRTPKFPTHNAPRVWFLTAAHTPIGTSLTRHLLAHGDYIVAGVPAPLLSDADSEYRTFLDSIAFTSTTAAWKARLLPTGLDPSSLSDCQSAMALALSTFGRIDVLFCAGTSTLVGAVEELAAPATARVLVRDQFESTFFAAVNAIKAALPPMRSERNGHIVVLTGITGHLGTPGLGIHCAAQWALEGYCDSLAYEVAPFNVRTTIVQPNVEVGVLTGEVRGASPLAAYGGENNAAPLFRDLLSGLLDRMEEGHGEEGAGGPTTGDLLHQSRISEVTPKLNRAFQERLVAETVYAVAAIGGHDNPPSRHIVGHEGVASVKEKLKTVSEELEEFVEVSAAVDIGRDEMPGLMVPS